jgi:predicted SAM-dependent methyltransferase
MNNFFLLSKSIINKTPFIKKLLLLFYYRIITKSVLFYRLKKHVFYQKIDSKIDNKKLMINIGGGHFLNRHWRTLDVPHGTRNYWKGTINYQFDLCTKNSWPFLDNSVYLFYSSYTLQQIHSEWLLHNLKEAYRCLKPGGGFRITVPDYDLAADAYENKNLTFFHKDMYGAPNLDIYKDYDGEHILEYAFLLFFCHHMWDRIEVSEIQELYKTLGRYKFADKLVESIPLDLVGVKANIKTSFTQVNWFNPDKLVRIMKDVGFSEVVIMKRHESRFKEISKKKSRTHGFDNSYPLISCYIEGYK